MTSPEASWPVAHGLRYSSSNTVGPCLGNGSAGKEACYQAWHLSPLSQSLENQVPPARCPLTSTFPLRHFHVPQSNRFFKNVIKYYLLLKATRNTGRPNLTDSKSKQEGNVMKWRNIFLTGDKNKSAQAQAPPQACAGRTWMVWA